MAKENTKTTKKPRVAAKTTAAAAKKKWQAFVERQPHRSFRLTKRRDYQRPPYIEGYIAFTAATFRLLWQHKRLFGSFVVVYAIVTALFVGLTSNENYRLVDEYTKGVLEGTSASNPLAEATVLFGVSLTGTLSEARSEGQQLFAGILILLGWLTMVWLLRQVMAGHAVRLRDGIYSAGAPIVSTFIVSLVILLQALPFLFALVVYFLLRSIGLFEAGIEAMLAWMVLILLAVMSLYWITASLVSMVIITLPGMYPLTALKKAGSLVLGRRRSVMMRIIWALAIVFIVWAVVLIPIIILDQAVRIAWLPVVPWAMLLLSSFTMVWFSTYVYMLYRRLIDGKPSKA